MPGLRLIAGATVEPVTLEDAKEHLRVEDSAQDAVIRHCIEAAQEYLSGSGGEAVLTQTWELVLDAFPADAITLPRRPLKQVVSIKYDDTAGVEQTVTTTDYIVDTASFMGRVVLAPGKAWPATRDAINAVRIQFKSGHDTLPGSYRAALLLLVGFLFERRGGEEVQIPKAVFDLIGVRGSVA